jgi:hypothetical protein
MVPMVRKVLIAATLTAIGLVVVGVGFWWLWGVLTAYIEPKTATDRKDLANIFIVIAAGVVGTLTAIAAVGNLYVSRRNLQQQRELDQDRREEQERALEQQLESTRHLEDQRSQDAALQAYFEQMGGLLTDHHLIKTEQRGDIRQLARAQTLTVLARVDGPRKGLLVRFLHGAGLIKHENPVIRLEGADLSQIDLEKVIISDAMLSDVNLRKANLRGAELIDGTDLSESDLEGADLREAVLDYHYGAARYFAQSGSAWVDSLDAEFEATHQTHLVGTNLKGANLHDGKLTDKQLAECKSLEGATMPDGQVLKSDDNPDGLIFEDWLKSKGSGELGENSGPS